MNITKKDISKAISMEMKLSNIKSKEILEFFINSIKINSQKNFVKISNFGVFSSKKTPARVGRNPVNLKSYKIKSFKKITFKASSKVKNIIN